MHTILVFCMQHSSTIFWLEIMRSFSVGSVYSKCYVKSELLLLCFLKNNI